MTELSDEQLIVNIAGKCKESFTVLMKRHQEALRAFINRYVQDPEKSKDIVQDAFLKIWLRAETYQQRNGSTAKTWIYTITLNTFRTDYRRRKKYNMVSIDLEKDDWRPFEITCPDPQPDRQLAIKQAMESAGRVIHRLPKEYRDALILREFYGMRYDHMAEHLQISIGTVKSRINRGRNMMKSLTMNAL